MHFASTMKSVVFIVALATQCVSAESQNGYLDKKFYVLAWITYLKRLSLIALMLCVVILYYVPKSRSHARRICCTLIDLIANGLKFVLNITETMYNHEKIKAIDQNELNGEPRIQELYRKTCKENTRIRLRHYDKMNIDDSCQKSTRRQQRKKSDANHSIVKKQKCHQRDNNRNAGIKDIPSESGAVNNSPQRKTTINEKWEKGNIIIPMNTSSKTKIMIYNTMMDKIENSIDLQQEEFPKAHDNYAAKDIETESSSCKKILNSSTVPEIKNKIEYKSPTCENSNHRECNYDSSHLFMAKARYGRVPIKLELHDRSRKRNCRFLLYDKMSITHDCYKNAPIIAKRTKPVLLRVVNWLFGGCPEASRRNRDQVEEVGKEETFESTNTWLL